MDGRIKFITQILQVKRKRIAKLIREGKANVICLQETHIKSSDKHYLKQVLSGKYSIPPLILGLGES